MANSILPRPAAQIASRPVESVPVSPPWRLCGEHDTGSWSAAWGTAFSTGSKTPPALVTVDGALTGR